MRGALDYPGFCMESYSRAGSQEGDPKKTIVTLLN